jgi:hypothetical protein
MEHQKPMTITQATARALLQALKDALGEMETYAQFNDDVANLEEDRARVRRWKKLIERAEKGL